ncbi:MAG: response regulator [Acidobacteria bacterium]|nr:response regulator [Acidobacteriota bacterium]MBI3425099.1 response regulator [Acidobacteriota bacterium]
MKLLIVEDNPAIRALLRRIAGPLAEAVYECADGAAALAAYQQYQLSAADWVLMDIQMPNVNGIEATRQLKAAQPEAHVCIVTQYDTAEWREAARAAGAAGFVEKENLLALWQILPAPATPADEAAGQASRGSRFP